MYTLTLCRHTFIYVYLYFRAASNTEIRRNEDTDESTRILFLVPINTVITRVSKVTLILHVYIFINIICFKKPLFNKNQVL